MDKDFKCKSCGLVFIADDSQEVHCPSCSSDNIDYFKGKKNGNKTYLWAGIAFIAAIGIGIGIKFIAWGDKDITTIDDEIADERSTTIIETPDGPTEVVGEPIKEVTLTYNNDLKPDAKTKTYSFSYRGNNIPEGAEQKYELYDFGNGNLVMTSPDGKFVNVKPASDDTGSYRVELKAIKGDQTFTASHIVTGCVKFPEAKLDKLTVTQVQGLVNQMVKTGNSAVLSTNPHFASKIKFKYQGLEEDDVAPTSFSKLSNQITMGIWKDMKVVGVNYDDNNQITEMTIQPVYAD